MLSHITTPNEEYSPNPTPSVSCAPRRPIHSPRPPRHSDSGRYFVIFLYTFITYKSDMFLFSFILLTLELCVHGTVMYILFWVFLLNVCEIHHVWSYRVFSLLYGIPLDKYTIVLTFLLFGSIWVVSFIWLIVNNAAINLTLLCKFL